MKNLVNGQNLLKAWEIAKRIPGGKTLYARALGTIVPYTGTVRPRLLELNAGHATLLLRDRPSVRNHLRSIHAIALANILELCSGLALLTTLSPQQRAILVALEISYQKKARGPIIASADCQKLDETAAIPQEHIIEAVATNQKGQIVATAKAKWRVDNHPSTKKRT